MSPASSQPPKANRSRTRSSAVVVPHQPRWYQRIAAGLVFTTIQAVAFTLRYRWTNRSALFNGEPPGPAIYCFWHNRLALCVIPYRSYVQKRIRTAGMAGLVSASKDGGFLAGVLECFQVQPVRGSSSRRGPQALLELTTWAARGYDLAITPDGPRGPRYVVQEGVMSLAQLTGLPIIPFTYNLDWKICVKSWDQFQVPLPFSRCEFNFDNPIHVPREATDAERETLRQRLESSLRSMSRD
jgi:lysophospholipid acyltransferase (LPLAT)-like uncharacterized protein